MSDNALAIRGTFDDTEKVAGAMVKSGYFTDTREVSQAIVKILAGREMGFGPFASMTGVYIIQGRPSVGANLMASAVKRSGRYDYRVLEMTDKVCTVEYTQGGKVIGQSSFTIEDARKAGTKNLDKFPRNMLFARAMSNGVRWFCPDVFDGAPVYTPEELGADVNETGEVIDYTPPTVTEYPPAQPAASEPPSAETVTEDQPVQPVTYSGPQAKIGRNRYPATWAQELMPQLAEWEINGFHLDGILQKLALPQDATAKAAVAAVQAYLNEKQAQS